MSVSIKNNIDSFYDLLLVENISVEQKADILDLLQKIDTYYDMADNSQEAKRIGAINRKIINQIVRLGFIACKYKLFNTNEITIDENYCKAFDDYATGKVPMQGIPEIYPINYENDNWTSTHN